MRLYIETEPGDRRVMLLLTAPTTVRQVKAHVEQQLGVPAGQQALQFGGRELPDESLIVEDLGLDRYNVRGEATVHMQRRLADPRPVWLISSATDSGRRQHLDAVERGASMRAVMQLLTKRGLAGVPFAAAGASGSGNVVVRRADGSTTRLVIAESDSVAQLEARIAVTEGSPPVTLTFMQAPDGCLHAVFGPSAGSPASSFPVYQRAAGPQPEMMKKAAGPGFESFGDLAARLCVNP